MNSSVTTFCRTFMVWIALIFLFCKNYRYIFYVYKIILKPSEYINVIEFWYRKRIHSNNVYKNGRGQRKLKFMVIQQNLYNLRVFIKLQQMSLNICAPIIIRKSYDTPPPIVGALHIHTYIYIFNLRAQINIFSPTYYCSFMY